MSENEQNLTPEPVGESEPAKATGDRPKKRYKYTLDESGNRLCEVANLQALVDAYEQAYPGESLPSWARTRRAGEPEAKESISERIASIHAAEQAARVDEVLRQSDPTGHAAKLYGVDPSRIEWVNWKGEPMEGDPRELRAAGKLIIARVRPELGNPAPVHSEQLRKEQLFDRLTGGLKALAGPPSENAL